MARIARDSTPKRRSARLSNQESARKTSATLPQLDAVLERDETPDTAHQPSIDNVVATPRTRESIEARLKELSKITTPKTEPRPDKTQMHPATIHQTTAKAPDSGLKLGFTDIRTTGKSVASLQNTPSRPRQSLAHTNISPSFKFKFSHDTNLSDEGQKLMDTIREEAAKIKERMQEEKTLQDQRDVEAEAEFESATGRKIARPTAKAGRFSDVHMAQFRKMDSVENHASAWRARPGYARPTTQSLKRTSTAAGLDEPERPKTAGKSPSSRIPPPVTGRALSISPFKTIRTAPSTESLAGPKRQRRSDDDDVSDNRPSTALPRPVTSRLLSPTKASAARANETTTPTKPSAIPRSNSVRSIRSVSRPSTAINLSPTKASQAQVNKPLPSVPVQLSTSPVKQGLARSNSVKSLASPAKESSTISRIPGLAGLKSILRSPNKNTQAPSTTPKSKSTILVPASSQKKVDFTPSVKSRYAVKLAENSPSPAKVDRTRVSEEHRPAIPYDSSAFVVNNDEEWEDEDSGVAYRTLPNLDSRPPTRQAGPVNHTIDAFTQRAKDLGRRESKEFKSIFTTLHPKPVAANTPTLTSVNTNLNRTNPAANAQKVATSPQKAAQSPSTIRQVRLSEPVQPFEDRVETIPHGLPGKKRRIQSEVADEKYGTNDDAKENRRVTAAFIPGAWNESVLEEDEGEKRGGKRARTGKSVEPEEKSRVSMSPVKKPSAARELAAKTAKERKVKASIGGVGAGSTTPGSSRGVLSLSRLNMLARPKNRG